MAHEIQQELIQAHALLDLIPPAKLGAVRNMLEGMIEEDDDGTLTEDDRKAIQVGLDSLDKHGPVSMDVILADFGLKVADFEKMTADMKSRSDG